MALGKNIEHLRALHGMSRGAVARAIGLDDDQPIYALEKRDSKRSNLAPALAKLFRVGLEELLSDDLTSLTSVQVAAGLQLPSSGSAEHPLADELLATYGQLNSESKVELLRFAEFLLSKERSLK